jgi:hypothetical protein
MGEQHIEGHGLVIDGTGFATPDEAIDEAKTFYEDKGKSAFELAKETTIAKNAAAVQFAWYDDKAGFVQQEYPGARQVTVVQMFANEKIATEK